MSSPDLSIEHYLALAAIVLLAVLVGLLVLKFLLRTGKTLLKLVFVLLTLILLLASCYLAWLVVKGAT